MADTTKRIILDIRSKGAKAANKALGDIKKSADDSQKAIGQLNKESKKVSENTAFSKLKKQFDDVESSVSKIKKSIKTLDVKSLTGGVKDLVKSFDFKSALGNLSALKAQFVSLGPVIAGLGPIVAGLAGALAALAIPVAGLFAAFKTAQIEPAAASFESLVKSFEGGDTLLRRLSEAAGGTIAQFDLLTSANLALAGIQGKVAAEFGNSLPKLLEVARVQARATGQSVDFLFNSLVEGIKRSSPLRIDNTGLVIKAGEANEEYAKKLGKTVDQLTAEEKQLALLNETLRAGNIAIEAAGGVYVTNAERIKRFQVTFQDLFAELGKSFQPLLTIILDAANGIADGISAFLIPVFDRFRAVNNVIQGFANIIGAFLAPALAIVAPLFDAMLIPIEGTTGALNLFADILNNMVVPAINFFMQPLYMIADVLGFVIARVRNIVMNMQQFGKVLIIVSQIAASYLPNWVKQFGNVQERFKKFLDNMGVDLDTFIDNMFVAGARMMGTLAGGMAQGAADVIQVVANVAEAIADFLIGQSPPPKGPLSNIDKGGLNTMLAWVDGMTQASLAPIENFAGQVNQVLADSIARMDLSAVNARLMQLDVALAPFQERVDILKAQLEALEGPTQQALSAIQSYQSELIKQFNDGNTSVVDRIRLIDQEAERLQKNLEGKKLELGFAQASLAIEKSKQNQERKLLEMRKASLSVVQKTVDATSAGGSSAIRKAKKPKAVKGDGVEPLEDLGGGLEGFRTGIPNIDENIENLNEQGRSMMDAFVDGFESEYDSGALDASIGNLRTQTGRVGEGITGLPERLFAPFETVGTDIQNWATSLPTLINDALGGLELPEALTTFPQRVIDKLQEIGTWISEPRAGFGSFFSRMGTAATNGIPTLLENLNPLLSWFTDTETEGTLAYGLFNFPTTLNEWLEGVSTTFTEWQDGLDFTTIFDIFGSGPDSIVGKVQQMLNNLGLKVPVFAGIWQQMKDAIGNVFTGFGEFLASITIGPIVAMFQGIVDKINDFLGQIEGQFNNMVGGLPEWVRNQLGGTITIPKINIDLLGAANGGFFTSGMLEVGERGRELIAPAQQIAVLPNKLTQAIEGLEAIMMGGSPTPMFAGSTNSSTVTNNSTFAPTINTSNSANVSIRELQSLGV
jgi:hypothetical protein